MAHNIRAVTGDSLTSLGGAGDESAQRANVSAFLQWELVPRMTGMHVREESSA